jgi:heterodisulfide reductase subunit C
MESEHPLTFAEQVRAIPGGEYLDKCYACGTCVSRCLIQQKLEPEYNPRRLLRLVMMERRKEAYESLTTWLCSACDLCYPACPQEIHISGVINAVRQLAVEAGYKPVIQSAKVNQQTCVGCGLCEQACPYDAITLEKTNIPFRGKEISVAQVDANKCMACGLCTSVCRSTSIELTPPVSSETFIENIQDWIRKISAEVNV